MPTITPWFHLNTIHFCKSRFFIFLKKIIFTYLYNLFAFEVPKNRTEHHSFGLNSISRQTLWSILSAKHMLKTSITVIVWIDVVKPNSLSSSNKKTTAKKQTWNKKNTRIKSKSNRSNPCFFWNKFEKYIFDEMFLKKKKLYRCFSTS